MNSTSTTDWVLTQQTHFESALQRYLPNDSSTLHQAMRYSALGAGKRLRPLLVYATGFSFNAMPAHLDRIAAAVECIHCYSLIHDDLPAMDDDDLRRGKPSCHKQFDEATAILAGDALQSLAFDLLTQITLPNQIQLVQILAKASGSTGMAGGQALDMQACADITDASTLETIHRLKTGALFHAAIQMSALASDQCTSQQLKMLEQFATHFGLAFQIRDDILDIESPAHELGKTQGKDISQNKATYPALLGLAQAKESLNHHINAAKVLIERLGVNTHYLSLLLTMLK